MFWLGLGIGISIGAMLGIILAAFLQVGKRGDSNK